jgi:Calcineurin-like phosphoesterase
MNLFPAFHWLRAPANHAIIERWTSRRHPDSQHTLVLPPPPDPARFEFLVLGDTGDSDLAGAGESPQDGVARELTADASLPGSGGRAQLVLHAGDIVYMTGERRLYDRNFRRPYAPFLTPDSTFERLVFRLPFLPVPGNHDYYDFPAWAGWLVGAPVLGAGFRAIARELFSFSIPRGGSDMGRAYMEAFVDPEPAEPQPYAPGRATRIPNRYYRFRYGSVEFFALDSNTLDGFPPVVAEKGVRADAARSVSGLDGLARETDAQIREEQHSVVAWREQERRRLASAPEELRRIEAMVQRLMRALTRLAQTLLHATHARGNDREAHAAIARASASWHHAAPRLERAREAAVRDGTRAESKVALALAQLDASGVLTRAAQRVVEEVAVWVPEGEFRSELLAAGVELAAALEAWSAATADTPPPDRSARLAALSETALEIQRDLARETQRTHYRAEDYDAEQLQWLDAVLGESIRERPDGWRVVLLHHPLYTTMRSYCESAELQEIRGNLLDRLSGRVHAIFSGHAHGFEWLRNQRFPHTGLFVSGGGGQMALGKSVLDPRRVERYARRVTRMVEAGVEEAAIAGRGPNAIDGAAGPLYHYLCVEVEPDVLRVRPVGVRRVEGGFRRETPMPVHHVPTVSPGARDWEARRVEAIEVRRGEAPRVCWAKEG